MKKILSVMLTLVLVLTMGAWTATVEDKITICVTTYPLYDLACVIGSEYVEVTYVPDGAIAETDILLCVNDEAEAPANTTVVKAIDGVVLIDEDMDVLTIPVNNMLCATFLVDALCTLDAEHHEAYKANLTSFVNEMSELDMAFREATASDMKISCNDGSMAYFAQEYGLEYTEDDDAIVLSTYNHTDEELLEVPYLELMKKNLDALTEANK